MAKKKRKDETAYLISVLRKGTLGSFARNECLRLASKKVYVRDSLTGKKIFKLHWQCRACKEWFRDKGMMEVDHIVEIGPFKGDWHDYIERMYFCPQSNLQALCVVCHQRKTLRFTNALRKFKRKKV